MGVILAMPGQQQVNNIILALDFLVLVDWCKPGPRVRLWPGESDASGQPGVPSALGAGINGILVALAVGGVPSSASTGPESGCRANYRACRANYR